MTSRNNLSTIDVKRLNERGFEKLFNFFATLNREWLTVKFFFICLLQLFFNITMDGFTSSFFSFNLFYTLNLFPYNILLMNYLINFKGRKFIELKLIYAEVIIKHVEVMLIILRSCLQLYVDLCCYHKIHS